MAIDKHVSRFDVPVNDADFMQVFQGAEGVVEHHYNMVLRD